jgi:hypothetical protein
MPTVRDIGIKPATFIAHADLDAYQYHFVESSGSAHDGYVQLCSSGSTTYGPIGILQNEPGAAGDAAEVMIYGFSQLYCTAPGTRILNGDFITSDASGHGVVTTTASLAHAVAMQNADASEVCLIEVMLIPGMSWLSKRTQ